MPAVHTGFAALESGLQLGLAAAEVYPPAKAVICSLMAVIAMVKVNMISIFHDV